MTRNLLSILFTLMLFFSFSIKLADADVNITPADVIMATVPGLQLPVSNIDCTVSGSLIKIIDPTMANMNSISFMSTGNAFFVSTADKKMAIFQHAENADNSVSVNVFVKADGVERASIATLLSNMTVITMNAQSIFYVVSMGAYYLYDGATQDSTITVRFRDIGNIMDGGMTYVAANGDVRIYYARPPVFEPNNTFPTDPYNILNTSSAVTCMFTRLPLDDENLPGVEEAFDGTLVDDILTASMSAALRTTRP